VGIIRTQSINNKAATNIGERAIRPHLWRGLQSNSPATRSSAERKEPAPRVLPAIPINFVSASKTNVVMLQKGHLLKKLRLTSKRKELMNLEHELSSRPRRLPPCWNGGDESKIWRRWDTAAGQAKPKAAAASRVLPSSASPSGRQRAERERGLSGCRGGEWYGPTRSALVRELLFGASSVRYGRTPEGVRKWAGPIRSRILLLYIYIQNLFKFVNV
jgi:hypothetical protein